tara:strand:- start:8121 stop:8552 length:432 start_codon:yes stop_codon:yes gene_type:complete
MKEISERSNAVKNAFNSLNAKNLDVLNGVYADAVIFEDPMSRIEGLNNLKAHFQKLYKNVISINFHFVDEVESGDTLALFWEMQLRAKSLKGGKPVSLEGMTKIIFNDRDQVILHKEYFDMGEFIYENIPLLGSVIKKIKQAL